jgi:hypothetical protein
MFQVETRCGGSGEPLVWLHHSGGHQDWFPLLDMLAEKHGLSAQPSRLGRFHRPGSPDDIIDMAIFYLDYFDAIGSSAPTSSAIPRRHDRGRDRITDRDSVRKLVLCDALALVRRDPRNDLFRRSRRRCCRPRSFRSMALGPR